MRKVLLILGLVIIITSIIGSLYIHFDNWDKIISQKDKFELNKWPIIGYILGILMIWASDEHK